MSTTSLKLPEDVKERAVAAAKRRGVTPHAFMVEAIRSATSAAERRAQFIADALSARKHLMRTGKGFGADDAHEYLRRRAQGETAPKPKARTWRG